jgi:uncharacterized protein (DUF305 family)
MKRTLHRWWVKVACVLPVGFTLAGSAAYSQSVAASPPVDFVSAMEAAMTRMDSGMMVQPSGDPDSDFALMMIAHHQGAIDMATAELRFGQDPVLRRLAQGIIVEQQQEITVMRQALAAPSPTSRAGRQTHPDMHMEH